MTKLKVRNQPIYSAIGRDLEAIVNFEPKIEIRRGIEGTWVTLTFVGRVKRMAKRVIKDRKGK